MIRAALWPVWRLWLIAYYRWALHEINPQHPDVFRIVLRLRELEGTPRLKSRLRQPAQQGTR